jgi:hypothetical protein
MFLYRSEFHHDFPSDQFDLTEVRNQIDLSATDFLPDQDATQPEVSYKDENITVYTFPISPLVPFPHYETNPVGAVELGQKRKRASESDGPSKVAKLTTHVTPELSPDEARENAMLLMFKPKRSSSRPVCSVPNPHNICACSFPSDRRYKRRSR